MDLEKQSDEWLMGQVRRNCRECLEILLRRYSAALLNYARRFSGSNHMAEEIFQEVCLQVWAKRKKYRFPLTFRSWLFAVAANKSRELYRKNRRHMTVSSEVEMETEETEMSRPDQFVISQEHAGVVNDAVQQLPQNQREVVVMRVWSGLSYGEIAIALNAKEGAVRATMHRALAKLRPVLSALEENT